MDCFEKDDHALEAVAMNDVLGILRMMHFVHDSSFASHGRDQAATVLLFFCFCFVLFPAEYD